MLEFVGRLMGISLRTRAFLPFAFPSLVWKALVGEGVDVSELRSMDGLAHKALSTVRDHAGDDAAFAAAFPDLRFTTFDCTGGEVELLPGGADIPVTRADRARYCDAVVHFRLHEFDAQLAALRRGLANLVPLRAMSLFTWAELDALVCGAADFDVALLREKTRYGEGYSASSPNIRLFWRVLARFTPAERSSYLRFCWGRSKLPPEGTLWTSRHTISRLAGGDRALPMSHTCFFQLDLPEYSSYDALRRALLTAILYGVGAIANV
jgi:hypothetical protein